MSNLTILGDTSGSVVLQAPAVAGSTTLTLPATTGTVLASGSTGVCRAWVKFSVNTGGTVTVNDNYNLNSVVRTAAGRFTFTFTNALANANYAVVTSQGLDPTNGTPIISTIFYSGGVTTPTTSSFNVSFFAPTTGGAFDPAVASLVVFGS